MHGVSCNKMNINSSKGLTDWSKTLNSLQLCQKWYKVCASGWNISHCYSYPRSKWLLASVHSSPRQESQHCVVREREITARCLAVCSSPSLPQPPCVTSTRTRRQQWRMPHPCPPSVPQTHHPHWPSPAHSQHSSSWMCHPAKWRDGMMLVALQCHCTTPNAREAELTLQDPPPRFSFHQRVFRMCSLPSSWSLSTAPLIAVRYGESTTETFVGRGETHRAIYKFESIEQHCNTNTCS
jgi:hypothetical protein